MIVSPCARRLSRAADRYVTGSLDTAGPTRCANTPSGIDRADSVPATQRTPVSVPDVTSRANVVLPTPESPVSTTPHTEPPGFSADWIVRNSCSRSISGHVPCMGFESNPRPAALRLPRERAVP
ncbi:Uncharacterised protein [Mycobacteroides abscessus subsp. abscessus]|nr:Uncharacterised protein [Mycobacteroides abscessus subsp. abscessus]